MKAFRIRVAVEGDSALHEAEGTFEDVEWTDLHDFVAAVNDVTRSAYMQSPQKGKAQIRWQRGEGLSTEVTLPNETLLADFLHRLRPVILNREATSFERAASILGHRIDLAVVRALIKAQRNRYEAGSQSLEVSAGDVVLNSDKVLKDWLNAFEYHRDRNKQAALTSLHTLIPLDATKVLFFGILIEKVKAAIVLGTIVEWIRQDAADPLKIPDFRIKSR